MNIVDDIKFKNGTKEELLLEITPIFPYTASFKKFNNQIKEFVPWHWHKEVELFYIKSGTLIYNTPNGKTVFPAGSGGLINSNILHSTQSEKSSENTIQILHLFDTSFIGEHGSIIEQKYISPVVSAIDMEVFPLYPNIPEQNKILEKISNSFNISENDSAYEIKLRSCLSEIWYHIFQLYFSSLKNKKINTKINDELKVIMLYIYEHYNEKITISDISEAAFISERKCFRIFKTYLHTTPLEYLKNYRLQKACHLLIKTDFPIPSISKMCGLGKNSYFGKIFKDYFELTPAEYRKKWQDIDIKRQK